MPGPGCRDKLAKSRSHALGPPPFLGRVAVFRLNDRSMTGEGQLGVFERQPTLLKTGNSFAPSHSNTLPDVYGYPNH